MVMFTNYGAGFDRKMLPSSTKLKEENRPGPSECAGRVPGVTGRWGGPSRPSGKPVGGRPGLAEGVQILPLTRGAASGRGGVRALGASFPASTLRQMLKVPDLPGPCPTAL